MKLLIIAILSLIVAVALGHFISDDAGFVVIGYGGKVFRTSFVFFAVLLVVGLTALYFAWQILYQVLSLKTRWLSWTGEYRRKRSQRALSNGLIALAEGKFGRAEQLLSRGADDVASPAVHYIGAAEAAQAQNATDRRDSYLSLAREAMPSAEVAIGIKRAEMQLANKQYEQARATLDYLSDRHPDNKQVLSLQQKTYQATGDANALLGLLPAMRRHRVYEPMLLEALEAETACRLLSNPYASFEDLQEIWQRLPKSTKSESNTLAAYTKQLTIFGHNEEAEKLLRKQLVRHWDAGLVQQYGDVRIQNVALQSERAQGWLTTRSDDPDLLLTLAKLSVELEDWANARVYIERLLGIAPSPIAYQLLAEVHEQAEELEAAHQANKEGLRLATNSIGGLPVVRA